MTDERIKQAIDDLYKFNVFTEKEKDALYDFLHTGEFCFLTFNGLYWKQTKNCVIIKVKNLKVTLTETRLQVERFQDDLSEKKGCHNCKHDKESPIEICDACLYGYRDNWELAE